jgi:hypothetical protein
MRYYIVFYKKKNGDEVETEIATCNIEEELSKYESLGYTDVEYYEIDEDLYNEPSEYDEWNSFDPEC